MPRAVLLATACSLAHLAAGCSGDDGDASDAGIDARVDAATDAAIDAPGGPFALTSPMLTDGGTFPANYTCNGANRSLPLAWSSPPAGTQGLAVLLVDTNTSLIHWAIYDIPVSRFGLPEDVDKAYAPTDVPGAHQARSFNAQVIGYLGPCPPLSQPHVYRFTLYALGVATLPGATESTSRADILTKVLDNDVASVTLGGSYTQPP